MDDARATRSAWSDGRMTTDLAPTGWAQAVQAGGLRLGGPLGRGSGGPRWSAVDETGARWALVQVEAAAAVRSADRLAALARVHDGAVAAVRSGLALAGGGVLVPVAAVHGADLGAVVAARGPLGAGEVVWVLGALARGLAALHAAGVVHGDVAPGNVVLGPDGPVLVDLVPGPDERGTPGFAPDDHRWRARPEGDLLALLALGAWLLAPGRGRTRDGSASAEQVLAVLAELRAAIAEPGRVAAPGAGQDGPARHVARALSTLPARAVEPFDPAVLARVSLRAMAGGGAPGTGTARAVRRRARARHRRRSPRAVLVVAIASAAVVTAGVVALASVTAVGDQVSARAAGVPAAGPVAAALQATDRRADALLTRDAPALAALTVPGSAVAAADRRALAALATGAVATGRPLAVTAAPSSVAGCSAAGRPSGAGCAVVGATTWSLRGSTVTATSVDLLLAGSTSTGWRVWSVRPSDR